MSNSRSQILNRYLPEGYSLIMLALPKFQYISHGIKPYPLEFYWELVKHVHHFIKNYYLNGLRFTHENLGIHNGIYKLIDVAWMCVSSPDISDPLPELAALYKKIPNCYDINSQLQNQMRNLMPPEIYFAHPGQNDAITPEYIFTWNIGIMLAKDLQLQFAECMNKVDNQITGILDLSSKLTDLYQIKYLPIIKYRLTTQEYMDYMDKFILLELAIPAVTERDVKLIQGNELGRVYQYRWHQKYRISILPFAKEVKSRIQLRQKRKEAQSTSNPSKDPSTK